MPSSIFSHLAIPGTSKTFLPPFLYGTAWKKELSASLVYQALQNGFTAIDTACQPRHYREDLVGEGVRKFLVANKSGFKRSDLYLQTKFTSITGQDPNNIPYDPKSTLSEQVNQSVATSLKNFTVIEGEEPYLDALVLHSPMPSVQETLEVWQTLERYVPEKIRNLGISNTDLFTLMELYERASIKPAVVQNRFHGDTKYDIALRKFCAEKGIVYQSFWTLTANPRLMKSHAVQQTAQTVGVGPANALYVLVMGLDNTVVLNGTTNQKHMKGDWDAVRKVRQFAKDNGRDWENMVNAFKRTIGEVRD